MEQTTFPNSRLPTGPRVPSFSGLLCSRNPSLIPLLFSGGFSGRPESITVPSVEPVSIQGIINRVPSQSAPSSETTGTASRRRVRPRVELTGTRSRPRGRAPETEQEGDTESPPTGSRSRVRSRFTGSTPKTTATGNRLRFKKNCTSLFDLTFNVLSSGSPLALVLYQLESDADRK